MLASSYTAGAYIDAMGTPSVSMFRAIGGVFGIAVLVSMANAVGMIVERIGLFN